MSPDPTLILISLVIGGVIGGVWRSMVLRAKCDKSPTGHHDWVYTVFDPKKDRFCYWCRKDD